MAVDGDDVTMSTGTLFFQINYLFSAGPKIRATTKHRTPSSNLHRTSLIVDRHSEVTR